MAAVLSDEVKQALQDIYYNVRTGRGKEAFALLGTVTPAVFWPGACAAISTFGAGTASRRTTKGPQSSSTSPWSRAAPWGCWWPCGAGS